MSIFTRPRSLGLAGSLLVTILALAEARAGITNRWSFNNAAGNAPAGTTFTDNVSGATARVVGAGATLTGSAITLPGTSTGNQTPAAISAYVDLPNGLISSKSSLTVEIWATPGSYQNFERLFDFGRVVQAGDGAPGEITGTGTAAPGTTQSSDGLTLTVARANLNQQRFEGKLNGVTVSDATGLYRIADTALATTAGTEYHYVMTFEGGVGSFGVAGGRLSWYRNGTLAATLDVGFRLNQIEDVNNWLGRSLFTADRMANVSFNEVRFYDYAFSASEVAASHAAGPNAGIAPPVAQPDGVTLHPGQKVRVPVLANDTGSITSSTVAVVTPPASGTATAQSDGTILYAHTTGAPATDTFTYRVSGAGGTSNIATATITFSANLRIPNTPLNVPSTPPPTALQLVNAFGALTFTQPVAIVSPPAPSPMVFVCEKGGLLKVVPDASAATPTQSTFLNLPALLTSRGETISTASEQGFLGLAFHPNYATNRFFYVFYSVTKSGAVYERVSRFTTQAGNPLAAETASELILIEQLDEATNHNGGGLAFGPDGYLYISLGDEGGQNSQYNNDQRIDKDFFSAIARIDVDKKSGSLAPNVHASVPRDSGVARYAVPPDNPFVGATSFNGVAVSPANVRTEFYATGFRNPWRFAFDGTDLWVADVGQDAYEEIDLVTKGGNYGWAYREANHNGPKAASTPAGFTSVAALYEYSHGSGTFQGNSITGGFVYRGNRVASLTGAYIFADYVSGNIWSLRRNGAAAPTVERIAGEGGIVAFGADPTNGDILMADIDGSRLLRLTANTLPGTYPLTLSETGLFADLTDLSPAPGMLPYAPNLTFWSDFAAKRRWFTIPNAAAKLTWAREGAWTYPDGTIWVKHFDMELTRTNPPTSGGTGPRKRIETRLLVKNSTGVYGVSYRWNEAETEATLVPEEGASFPITVTENGISRTQTWQIPSRSSCLNCHNANAGGALSFNTRQLNQTGHINGFLGNQIDLLAAGGYFENTPESPNLLPRHLRPDETSYPVEARVRSFLAVNCAYCHMPGGPSTPAAWDGRPNIKLAQTGLINGASSDNGGSPANKLVVPGDVTHSVVYNRVAVTNGFTRMPPLATAELDQTSIALLQEWIATTLPNQLTYDQWRQNYFGSTTSTPGEPTEDPDGDTQRNDAEFVALTNPTNGSSFLSIEPIPGTGTISVSFNVPANRSAFIETSTDLVNWTAWNVPGNNTIPRSGGTVTLTGPALGAKQFLRLNLQEN